MKHELQILSRMQGHAAHLTAAPDVIDFIPATEWDPQNAAEVKAAAVTFMKLMEQHFSAFATLATGEQKRITEFDPSATKIALVKAYAGG